MPAVIGDRRADGCDAGRHVLIGHRDRARLRAVRGSARIAVRVTRGTWPHGAPGGGVEVRMPGLSGSNARRQRDAAPRCSGSERPSRSSSSITRAPPTRRCRRLEPAANAREDGLSGLVVQALHDRERRCLLVEAVDDDGAAEIEQLEAHAIGSVERVAASWSRTVYSTEPRVQHARIAGSH